MAKIINTSIGRLIFITVILCSSVLGQLSDRLVEEVEPGKGLDLLFGIAPSVLKINNDSPTPIYGGIGLTLNARADDPFGLVANYYEYNLLNTATFDTLSYGNPVKREIRFDVGIQLMSTDQGRRGLFEVRFQQRPDFAMIFSVGGESDLTRSSRLRLLLSYSPREILKFGGRYYAEWSLQVGLHFSFKDLMGQ